MDVKEALKIVLMLLLNNQPGPSHSDRTNSRSTALSLDTEVRSRVYSSKQFLTPLPLAEENTRHRQKTVAGRRKGCSL